MIKERNGMMTRKYEQSYAILSNMNMPACNAYDHALNVYSQGQLFGLALPNDLAPSQNSSPYSTVLLRDFTVGCLLIAATPKFMLSSMCKQ